MTAQAAPAQLSMDLPVVLASYSEWEERQHEKPSTVYGIVIMTYAELKGWRNKHMPEELHIDQQMPVAVFTRHLPGGDHISHWHIGSRASRRRVIRAAPVAQRRKQELRRW
jgi:hypothetical protein